MAVDEHTIYTARDLQKALDLTSTLVGLAMKSRDKSLEEAVAEAKEENVQDKLKYIRKFILKLERRMI